MISGNSNTVLITRDLAVGYTDSKLPLTILSNLNIEVKNQKMIAILGKNGSGKSTLLRTLARLQPALNGEIYLSKNSIENISLSNWAKQIAVVLTEIPSLVDFTVYEMVALGRQVHTDWLDTLTEEDKKKIAFAVEITHIQELITKKFYRLSDGQKQRVMIARALAQDTPIIMLDEPTVHLDVHHSMELMVLFQKLVREHQKTVLLTTHEIGLSCQLADELWILDKEQLYFGDTDSVLQQKRINQVFDTELIQFNSETKNFEYKK